LHVAIIMDGNGRWATSRGLPRSAGHAAGVRALKRTIDAAPAMGVATLTVYAFSSDNWQRPAGEVTCLMRLLRSYLSRDIAHLVRTGVRLEVIGRRDRLAAPLVNAIESAERRTQPGHRMVLRVALDYSSRDQMLKAAASCNGSPTRAGMTRALDGPLQTGDVDLMIRTSGEQRLSDFLLWESAYAELHFTDRLWPDFDACDLAAAIGDYHRRERRYGSLPAARIAFSTTTNGETNANAATNSSSITASDTDSHTANAASPAYVCGTAEACPA